VKPLEENVRKALQDTGIDNTLVEYDSSSSGNKNKN
jgi:hypothetical protein